MSRLKREPANQIGHSSLTVRATPRAGSSDRPLSSRTALSPREPGAILRALHAGAAGGRCSSEPAALSFSECFL